MKRINQEKAIRSLKTLAVLGGQDVIEAAPALSQLKISDFDREQILKAEERRQKKLERNRRNAKN